MLINGERTRAASRATMEVREPATGQVVESGPRADAADTRRAIAAGTDVLDYYTDQKSVVITTT